jgi:hypothetical protein
MRRSAAVPAAELSNGLSRFSSGGVSHYSGRLLPLCCPGTVTNLRSRCLGLGDLRSSKGNPSLVVSAA